MKGKGNECRKKEGGSRSTKEIKERKKGIE
jgi:hypothetical protein